VSRKECRAWWDSSCHCAKKTRWVRQQGGPCRVVSSEEKNYQVLLIFTHLGIQVIQTMPPKSPRKPSITVVPRDLVEINIKEPATDKVLGTVISLHTTLPQSSAFLSAHSGRSRLLLETWHDDHSHVHPPPHFCPCPPCACMVIVSPLVSFRRFVCIKHKQQAHGWGKTAMNWQIICGHLSVRRSH
jgi:hypothetical protein